MAFRFATEGMKVVLADIESDILMQTVGSLKKIGADVLAVRTDVAKAEDVENLARKTIECFGAVHVLANNAGVGSPPGPIWERTMEDWEWILGVNLWGVIHGIRVFVPIMLRQRIGHIVNTASLAGLVAGPLLGIYDSSKHAVVAISETLHFDLAMTDTSVRTSVICPGPVQTRIKHSERNRPGDLSHAAPSDAAVSGSDSLLSSPQRDIPPDIVADRVIQAIRNEQFYVLTHPEYKSYIRARMENIVAERNPSRMVSREMRVAHVQSARSNRPLAGSTGRSGPEDK
jgi:NAD(P)-dependent dehydrogenase (short-subunit alcohol dehydrogenase family)